MKENCCSTSIRRSSLVILQPSQPLISIASRIQCCVHSGGTCRLERLEGLELATWEELAFLEATFYSIYGYSVFKSTSGGGENDLSNVSTRLG